MMLARLRRVMNMLTGRGIDLGLQDELFGRLADYVIEENF